MESMVGRDSRDDTARGRVEPTIAHPVGEASGDGVPDGAADAEMPEQLGRFQVIEELGHGGMGMVYLAEDPDLGRRVAIKLLHERVELESRGRARLEREARALAALSHPNVVHVYEIGSHEGHVFVAMERVPGRSLRDWLFERERSWQEIVEMFCAAGDGLAAAHRAGIVHRDFKPDNVLVDPDGRPRVLDFGLATPVVPVDPEADPERVDVALDGLTATGTVMGTPVYMAPEQHTGGTPDARSDQFSFCVALFEALFGARPFQGETLELLREAVLRGRIVTPSNRSIPRRVVAAVRRGLSTAPEERHASVQDLLAELRAAAATSWRRPAVMFGVAALGLAVAVAVASRRGTGDAPPRETASSSAMPRASADPWRLSSRTLTKTAKGGIDSASIDHAGTRIVYASEGGTWSRALAGGMPDAVDVPNGGRPWWITLAGGDETIFGIVDGALWRFAGPQGPAAMIDPGPTLGNPAISRGAAYMASLRDERLTIRDLAKGERIDLDFPRERGAGASWDPTGTRLATHTRTEPGREIVRIFDARGRILAWRELGERTHDGVLWVSADRLVMSAGTYTELSLVCLAFDEAEGTVETIGRSEGLEHPYAQIALEDATDDGTVLVRMARSIRDVAVGPTWENAQWSLASPELEAMNRSAAWLGEGRIAMVSESDLRPTAVMQELASGDVEPVAAIAAPVRRLSTAHDGTLVAIVEAAGAEPPAVVVLPQGATVPRVVPDSTDVAKIAVDVRCDGARACVIVSETAEGAQFHTLTLPTGELVAQGRCPASHSCTTGTFAPSPDATRVLVPTRDFKRLEWLTTATGEVAAPAPAAPPGYEVGSAVAIPGTDDVIATMTLDSSARSSLPTYVIARLSPTEPPRTLWTSTATYFRRPVSSPDGSRVALDAATFHTEAVLIEGSDGCRTLRPPE